MNALAGAATQVAEMASTTTATGSQQDHQVGALIAFCDTILTIIPAALMIAVCPIYIRWYHGMKMVTFTWDLALIKLISIAGLLVLEAMRFMTWFEMQDDKSPLLSSTTSAASLLSTIATVALGIAMFYDHFYAPRSTSFLSLFLTVSAVAEGLKAKYLPSFGELNRVATLSVGCMICKTFLILLLEMSKTLHSTKDGNIGSPGNISGGFWGSLWTLGAVFHGFRNHLSLSELSSFGMIVDSEELLNRIEVIWDNTDQSHPYALFKTCIQAFSWPIFVAWLACIGEPAARFICLLMKMAALDYLQNPQASPYTPYQLVGTFALCRIMLAMSHSIAIYPSNQVSLRLRGALTGLLLRKQMNFSLIEANESPLPNLIASDIEKIMALVPEMCRAMSSVPELMFGFYLTTSILGKGFVTPLCVIIAISISIGWYTEWQLQSVRELWNQRTRARIAKTAEILKQIRAVKMIGLESIILPVLKLLGSQEADASKAVRKYRVIVTSALPLNYMLVPLVAFRIGIKSALWQGGLDHFTPWIVLTLLLFIRAPMWELSIWWPKYQIILTCLARLQNFLNLEERVDPRQLRQFSNPSQQSAQYDTQTTRSGKLLEAEMHSRVVSLSMVSIPSRTIPETNFLSDLDFSILSGTLTMVVGGPESGKTQLLRALLGEVHLNNGSIHMSYPEMAYCGQRSWIQNDTIQNVILGGSVFDDARYHRVVEVCKLDMDIRTLGPSEVGSNGDKLNIQQRQRIVLARALYSFCPLIVCDDVFGALDDQHSTDIFNAVFGRQGLLKEQQRTAVLVVNEPKRLSFADQIVYLNGTGTAAIHRGAESVKEFVARNGDLINFSSNMDIIYCSASTTSEDVSNRLLQSKQPVQKSYISLFCSLFRPVPSLLFVPSLLLTMLNGFMERSPDLYVREWLQYRPSNTSWIFGMTALSFLSAVTASLGPFIFHMKVVSYIASQFQTVFYDSLMRATLPYLSNPKNSALLDQLSEDITSLHRDVPQGVFLAISGSSLFFTVLGFVTTGIHHAALLTPLLFFGFWLVQKFHIRALRQARSLDAETKTPFFTAIREMNSGLEHVRSFGWQRYVLRRTLGKLDNSQKAVYHAMTTHRWAVLVQELLGATFASVSFYMAIMSANAGSFTTIAFAIHGMDSLPVIGRQMVENWTHSRMSMQASQRLGDFAVEMTASAKNHAQRFENAPVSWEIHGNVEFRNFSVVSASRPGQSFALERISTTFNAGQKVVVTGNSGSGKTTLLLSLLNLVDGTSGQILIDGVDISKISPNVLRSNITSLPAQHIDLPGTLLDNLLSRPHDEKTTEDKPETKSNEVHTPDITPQLDGHNEVVESIDAESSTRVDEAEISGHNTAEGITHGGDVPVAGGVDNTGEGNTEGNYQGHETTITDEKVVAETQCGGDDKPEAFHPIHIPDAIVEGVLRDVGLWNLVDSRGGVQTQFANLELSTSQKQQVNIARAILHHIRFRTKIILMDEPTLFIEDDSLNMIQETLELAFGHCTRVIVSSEARDVAECDLILRLSNGLLVQVDIVQSMDEELTNAFEKLTNKRLKNSSQTHRSQPAAPEGTTGEASSQTHARAAVAFEGEMPPGALVVRNPLDPPANRTNSDGSRDSAREPADSESAISLQPGAFSQGKLDHVISTRATAVKEMSASAPETASSPPSEAPGVYQGVVRAYKNHYVMDNGEQRVSYSLRRVDLRYKHHEHPYPSSVRRQIDMEEVDYWELQKDKKSLEK